MTTRPVPDDESAPAPATTSAAPATAAPATMTRAPTTTTSTPMTTNDAATMTAGGDVTTNVAPEPTAAPEAMATAEPVAPMPVGPTNRPSIAARLATWARDPGRLAAFAVFVVVLALHAALLPSQGLTDDDDFYAPAGIRYAEWLKDLITQPTHALNQAAIDVAFKPNNEHPPFAKYVMGVSHGVTHSLLGVYGDLDGARFGVALLAALLCAVLVRLCWRPLGPGYALFAAAALVSLPRFFFHSEVATLDVPVSAMVVLTTAAFFWGETSRRWAWATGVVFGLALLTKLNAPFAAIPATMYAIATRWRGFSVDRANATWSWPPIPRSLVAMAVIGPVIFVALWPWLWFDTAQRFGSYVAFHLNHYPILLFFEGEIWNKPFAPSRMPFVMAAGTTPFPVLVLGLMGLLVAARSVVRIVRGADTTGALPHTDARDKLQALVLLEALFAIGIVAFSNVPKYGGEKLFMPFFPLFCVLAAAGLRTVVDGARALAPRLPPRAVLAVAAGLAVLPGLYGTAKFFGGYGLSYYGEALGGLRGAVAHGYERTYYDIADKPLARWLDENAGSSSIHFEPNHKEYVRTYRWLKRDGVIDRDVSLTDNRGAAEVLVLTHERRWSTYPGLLDEARRMTKVNEKRIDDVPLWTVYRRR